MKESLNTIKAFFGGWVSFAVGIGAVAIILYILYLMLKRVLL